MSIKHFWECDDCGRTVDFYHPERPQIDPRSEQNDSKTCTCGGMMFFEEHPPAPVVGKLVTPPDLEDIPPCR